MTTGFYNDLRVNVYSDQLFDNLSKNAEDTIKLIAANIVNINLLNIEFNLRNRIRQLLKGAIPDMELAFELMREQAPWAERILRITKLGGDRNNLYSLTYILEEYYKEVLY